MTNQKTTLREELRRTGRLTPEIKKQLDEIDTDTPKGCGKGDCGNCNPFTGEVMLHPECQKKTPKGDEK